MAKYYDEKSRKSMYKYNKKCDQFIFRLRKDKDGDIIDFLRSQDNFTECIRRLVRAEILRKRGGVLELD